MIIRALPLYGLCFLVACSSTVHGQTQSRQCLSSHAPPDCSSWVVTESGVYLRFTDIQTEDSGRDEHVLFNYTLGWMRNTSSRTALGAQLFGGAEGEVRGGVAARVRHWLSTHAAFDAAAGVHLVGSASSQDVQLGSPMLLARITYGDRLALASRADVLFLRCRDTCTPGFVAKPNGTSIRLYVGGELGSELGVIGMLLTGLAVAVVVVSYPGL